MEGVLETIVDFIAIAAFIGMFAVIAGIKSGAI